MKRKKEGERRVFYKNGERRTINKWVIGWKFREMWINVYEKCMYV